MFIGIATAVQRGMLKTSPITRGIGTVRDIRPVSSAGVVLCLSLLREVECSVGAGGRVVGHAILQEKEGVLREVAQLNTSRSTAKIKKGETPTITHTALLSVPSTDMEREEEE